LCDPETLAALFAAHGFGCAIAQLTDEKFKVVRLRASAGYAKSLFVMLRHVSFSLWAFPFCLPRLKTGRPFCNF
jgi:hypothetical protein